MSEFSLLRRKMIEAKRELEAVRIEANKANRQAFDLDAKALVISERLEVLKERFLAESLKETK